MKRLAWLRALLWAAQAAAEGAAVYALWRLGMLPGRVWMALLGLFAAALALSGLLLLKRHKSALWPAVGAVLAVLLAALSLYTVAAAGKLNQTVERVTAPENRGYGAVLGGYVRANDPAATLEELAGERFGVLESLDRLNTDQALSQLAETLGQEPAVETRDSPVALAEALYTGALRVILLNEAYVPLLEDEAAYANFAAATRELGTVPLAAAPSPTPDPTVTPEAAAGEGPFVLYLSGLDTRSPVLSTSRSDVNILMVVNPDTRRVLLVNTPRDYFVPNPAGGGALDKLTHCGIYGVDCSAQALSDLYRVPVDNYAQINFRGFETLIDALGGVTVENDAAFGSGDFYFPAGEISLNGAAALAFARDRYHQAGGDNDRGKNQMKVLTAMIAKLSSGTTLLSNYGAILDSLQGMFVTDMSAEQIGALVKLQLRDPRPWQVETYAVTGDDGFEIPYSMPGLHAYVMIPHEETVLEARERIENILAGEE